MEGVRSRYIYKGKVIALRVDELEDGRVREVVEHNGSVAILPVLDDGRVVLERHYRHAIGKELIEIPAGKVEEGESVEECAQRELVEETGYRAGRLEYMGRCYMTPGYCNELIHFFIASNLERVSSVSMDEDEEINLLVISIDEAIEKALANEIEDAKTLYALLRYAMFQH
ncbi:MULTISPECIES: NUDIX hydrolase [Candidatus Nitrosocaldus]|jgi:ADP-ribose pyrophosphatase|uniref:NUDIX hydrolase n=1 Tax=Candidatus Nitrosocaldus cavascurensis TaxID=2058097 RepID=A0A2K5ANK3_9ARCH|nr:MULTISPECIES: NUDIX hydrolase [Candidatus Nitrosocaldus]SPC33214.1 NUDIX hydrolase [Candidatus Nitrosocaldus cavascurensis]